MPSKRSKPQLGRLSDDALLDLRLCDLNVKIERTPIARCVRRLHDELEARDIHLRPHVWLSSEWFSPDGIPGIAIPFYLAHPRLRKLEERMMLEVEGGSEQMCMRLLRHEAGHTMSTAYRLHYRKRWRELFGRVSQPYPASYQPKPYSRGYVVHLARWYAQAHPAEDFAETFAVWLRPGARWRQEYKGWPALHKLQYVDELMKEIAGVTPPMRSRCKVEPLSQLRYTLREHYRRKHRLYADEWPEFMDRELKRLFSAHSKYAENPTAAAFLRTVRPQIRNLVAEWTGVPAYTIDQVLRDMIDRCKELKLRLARPQREARNHAMLMVTVQTMNYLLRGHYRIAL
jgi:hypothetical protein